MRPKRSKQYKKLIQQFHLHHGFREPYQVLVDADLVTDAQRFTMDLQAGLERTLHGKVKIMITQCCIRHLYARAHDDPSVRRALDVAKSFERRRCGHRPEEYPDPLSTLDCLCAVVDGKGRGENKNRYIVASQDLDVRRHMRGVSGVPLIYISRSVMIMEPMSESTARVGAQAERAKFRSELRTKAGEKRKRQEAEEDGPPEAGPGDSEDGEEEEAEEEEKGEKTGHHRQNTAAPGQPERKKKKGFGPKAPNPLSVKKKKPKATPVPAVSVEDGAATKKKRKRKHKAQTADEGAARQTGQTEQTAGDE